MTIRGYFSNLKWLLLAFRPLLKEVRNWQSVVRHYIIPLETSPLSIRFRNNDSLSVPEGYMFEPIAETLLLNAYGFESGREVVVDVGAGIGDFVLLASRNRRTRVYAYEPNSETFQCMKKNVVSNNLAQVFLFNTAVDDRTLQGLIGSVEQEIDFLKVDCEGCEYDLLLHCPVTVLAKIRRIAMEIHLIKEHSASDLITRLKEVGFQVAEKRPVGQGHYVYASHFV